MKDKDQLLTELKKLRARIAELEKAESKHKQAEEALQRSQIQYKTLVDCAPVGVWEAASDGSGGYINAQLAQIAGLTLEKATGTGWASALHSDDRERVFEEWMEFVQGKAPYHSTYRFQHSDGSVRWVIGQAARVSTVEDEHLGFIGTLTDITDSKKIEEELKAANQQLKASEQQLKAANQQLDASNQQLRASEQELRKSKETAESYLNVAAEIIITLDSKGKITLLNDNAHKLLGYKKGELVGKDWFSTCVPEKLRKDVWSVFKKLMKGEVENVQRYENPVVTRTGQEKMILWHNTVLRDDGKIIGILSSGEDITERKRAEEERRASDERFRIAQDMSPDGFTILRPIRNAQDRVIDFTWVYENESIARLNGTDPQKVVGQRLLELFPGHRGTKFLKAYIQVAESGKSITFEEGYSGESMSKSAWFRIVVVPMAENIAILAQDITERKQAEQVLHESETRFKNLFNSIRDSILIADTNRKMIQCNPAFTDLFGYAEDEIIGKETSYIYKDLNEFKEMGQKLKEKMGDPNFFLTISYKKRSGEIFPGETNVFYLRNKEGEIQGFIGMIRDITERKQAEEKMAKAAREWQATFDAVNDAIWILDKDQNIINSNKSAESMFHHAREKMIGKHCWEIVHHSKEPIPECPLKRSRKSLRRETMELQIDEGWFLITVDPILDQAGEFAGAVHSVKNITERKNAEELLQESKEKYKTLIESSTDSIFVIVGGKIKYANKELFRISGYNKEQVIGQPFLNFVAPDERKKVKKLYLKRLVGKKAPDRYESKAVIKSGECIPVDVSVIPIKYQGKKAQQVICRDISARKKAEKDLQDRVKELKSLFEVSQLASIQDVSFEELFKHVVTILLASMQYPEITCARIIFGNDEFKSENYQLTEWKLISKINMEGEVVGTVEVCYLEEKPEKDEGPFLTEEIALVESISEILGTTISKKQAEQALQESKERFRAIFELAPDAIYLNNLKGVLLDGNRTAEEMLGIKREELIGKSFLKLHLLSSSDLIKAGKLLALNVSGRSTGPNELTLNRADGSKVEVEIRTHPLQLKGKKAVLGIARDITERKRAEKQIERDLKEKTILLSEVHHRVKNSLQLVASLLQLQSQEITDKHILDLFQQSRNRIKMMAAVYEKLYQSKNFASINYKEYLKEVLNSIMQSLGMTDRISLKLDIKNVVLGLDDATPVALIINELFTNSLRHAFPGDRKGNIEIKFKLLDDETHQLIYRDDGVGLPDDVDFDSTKSLGLFLIKNLAQQVCGEATVEQNGWTTFKIEFKGYGYGKKKHSNR